MMFGASFSASAKEIDGVKVPKTFQAGGASLVLNGAGIRTKWFLDIYVGALYLESKSSDANEIINADKPMTITLHMVSGLVSSSKMKSATEEGFDNSLHGKTQALQPEIKEFISVFEDEINDGDQYDLVYLPGKGVEAIKNGKLVKTIGGGLAFKKALFGIWLSDQPAEDSLKEEMLGKSDD
jgi:hypothetical protein